MKVNRSLVDVIDPGELDTLITIREEELSESKDQFGEHTITYIEIKTKAKIIYQQLNESVELGRISDSISINVIIRYRTISHSDRISIDGIDYNIKAAYPIGRKRYLFIKLNKLDK